MYQQEKAKYKKIAKLLLELNKEINEDATQSPLEDDDKKRLNSAVQDIVRFCEASVEIIETNEGDL